MSFFTYFTAPSDPEPVPEATDTKLSSISEEPVVISKETTAMPEEATAMPEEASVMPEEAPETKPVDPIIEMITHPYIHQLMKNNPSNYHCRAIYDEFYCAVNRERRDEGFLYMKSRVSRMGCDSVLGENYNIKYHTGNLVASEPIQFRVEVLNQMIADYQRAKTYVPDVRNID